MLRHLAVPFIALFAAGSVRNHPTLAPAGTMSAPRSGHTATLLVDGWTLIAGGMIRNGAFLDSADLFDPQAGRFLTTMNRMSTTRVGHCAVALANGRVLIAGGWGGGSGGGGLLSSAELFNPVTATFTATGSMNEARGDFTATVLRDGRVLIAGGVDEHDQPRTTAELYDPRSGRFTRAGSMTEARAMHAAAGVDGLENAIRLRAVAGVGWLECLRAPCRAAQHRNP